MFTSISAKQLHTLSNNQTFSNDSIVLNVCTPAEYEEERIADSINIPLDQLATRLHELQQYKHIYVHCRSGKRSLEASKILAHSLKSDIYNITGGLVSWKESGFATQKNSRRLPIIRQVFIAASLLLWAGLVGYYFIGELSLLLIAVVATGLLVSGMTGWCGMAFLLAKMPWNRS